MQITAQEAASENQQLTAYQHKWAEELEGFKKHAARLIRQVQPSQAGM